MLLYGEGVVHSDSESDASDDGEQSSDDPEVSLDFDDEELKHQPSSSKKRTREEPAEIAQNSPNKRFCTAITNSSVFDH